MGAFLNAMQNYPLLKGQQSNLFKCFLPLVWQVGSGVQALLHPEGPYDDLTVACYARPCISGYGRTISFRMN